MLAFFSALPRAYFYFHYIYFFCFFFFVICFYCDKFHMFMTHKFVSSTCLSPELETHVSVSLPECSACVLDSMGSKFNPSSHKLTASLLWSLSINGTTINSYNDKMIWDASFSMSSIASPWEIFCCCCYIWNSFSHCLCLNPSLLNSFPGLLPPSPHWYPVFSLAPVLFTPPHHHIPQGSFLKCKWDHVTSLFTSHSSVGSK